MKKTLTAIIAAVAVMCSAPVQAQEQAARFGARVAFDVNSPVSDNETYNNGTGFSFGAVYNIPLIERLYFEPGLSFFYNTMGQAMMQSAQTPFKVEAKLQNCGFRVPLAVGYRLDLTDLFSLAVYTGPQINYGLTLKEKLGDHSTGLYGNGYGHFDAQWLFGVRLHYIDNWFAEISGGIGIGNMCTGDLGKMQHLRRNIASIGVGYMF